MSAQQISIEKNTSENAASPEGGAKWQTVCEQDDLVTNSGICALVNGEQVAIFCLYVNKGAEPSVYALSNYDPIGKANVISRGILGSIGDELVIASPLYKQHFSLLSGKCIELPEHSLKVYPVRIHNNEVQIARAC